jgi:5'(3')-deoxyribonucleotidase
LAGIIIEIIDKVVRRKDILTTDLDGEIGMINIETGKYYSLDLVSSSIWHLIDQPISVKQIIEKLMEEYEVDEITCSQQTLDFLTNLHDKELIDIL